MNSKDFENICLLRMRQHEERGEATMSRYGVQANMIDGTWTPVSSLPDFEGLGLWLEVKPIEHDKDYTR
jgi:hypothetical protein